MFHRPTPFIECVMESHLETDYIARASLSLLFELFISGGKWHGHSEITIFA